MGGSNEIQQPEPRIGIAQHRLLALPDWIEVYPAHFAGSVCGRGMDGKTISTLGRVGFEFHPLLGAHDDRIKKRPPKGSLLSAERAACALGGIDLL
jgi:hypothetical protein